MAEIKTKKQVFLIGTLFFFVQFGYGQKTEIRLNAYSGLFSFRGNGTASTSWINATPYTSPNKFTSNPYGRKNGVSYSLGLEAARVTKHKNIYGLGISFETLTSKVNIDTVTENGFIYWQYPANGKTTLKNTFITMNPFVGKRLSYRKFTFDLLAGLDLGFCLKSREEGNATATTKNYTVTVDNEISKPVIDWRPGLQIKTQYNKLGFIVGYSLGLTNYRTPTTSKAYSNFLRLGFSYQMK